MFTRPMQVLRFLSLQSRYRLFSSTTSRLNLKQEENSLTSKTERNDIQPSVLKLPSYLPEPTGVKSALFNDFYLIYRLGYQRPLRYVQVLKLTQTIATACITPYQIYNYNQGLLTLLELQFSLFLLSLASFSLFMFGWFATRTVCYIYTTVECDRVILTHIDFWGRRRNIELDTRDIVPINDIETPNKTVLLLKRYSTPETMYYSVRIGQILDRPRFNRIFAGIITQDTKSWW
ncbi:unnamed protein product [Adineta ricciae]|uniref:Transmembrane protein 186 n=1 Tax=Adineta ricciae TaxID=249248 RepID=A0A815IQQ9_ADIRI|nr:unnamed protein product [Adineta ricciae]CAF1368794.1 unnamed protein product [Adineta ricciae]